MLLINFKTYPQVLGPKALALALKLENAAKDFQNIEIGFAPPDFELAKVVNGAGTPVWAQHTDPAKEGQFTGYLAPKDAKKAGAVGTFLNHSEHPLEKNVIKETTQLAKSAGLKVLIFADSPEKVAEFKEFSPDYIAYEPPELIGGDISVTSAKPKIIGQAVKESENIPLLVGAGVHGKEDVTTALSLGAIGAVVSSAVVKAEKPEDVFLDLLSGF